MVAYEKIGYMKIGKLGLIKYKFTDAETSDSKLGQIFSDVFDKEQADCHQIQNLQTLASILDKTIYLDKNFVKSLHPNAQSHPSIIKGKYIKPQPLSKDEKLKALTNVNVSEEKAEEIISNLPNNN